MFLTYRFLYFVSFCLLVFNDIAQLFHRFMLSSFLFFLTLRKLNNNNKY